MNSRLTIEIDYDNRPIIRIFYSPSPDVRDSLVKRFLETFGGGSEYASFRFVHSDEQNEDEFEARIRPLKPEDMEDAAKIMLDVSSGKRASDSAINGGGRFIKSITG